MEKRKHEITSKNNANIAINVIPGHFATNHSHVNYYIDLTGIKTRHLMSKEAAYEMTKMISDISVDTIICQENTELLGGFIAERLSSSGNSMINTGKSIYVICPELNSNNQMVFRDNLQHMIYGKRIMLLISSVSTGKTINRATECIRYYGGELVAVCSIFSAIDKMNGMPVHSLFTPNDVQGYETHLPADCPGCKEKRKLDAIINSYGYSKLNI